MYKFSRRRTRNGVCSMTKNNVFVKSISFDYDYQFLKQKISKPADFFRILFFVLFIQHSSALVRIEMNRERVTKVTKEEFIRNVLERNELFCEKKFSVYIWQLRMVFRHHHHRTAFLNRSIYLYKKKINNLKFFFRFKVYK